MMIILIIVAESFFWSVLCKNITRIMRKIFNIYSNIR